MRICVFALTLTMVTFLASAAMAIDPATIDNMELLLQQPEWNEWGNGAFDDTTLYDGLTAIYARSVNEGDSRLLRKVIWAMGETRLIFFVPMVIGVLPDEPEIACFALGKIPSEDAVDALIEMLDDSDKYTRDAAAWGLGNNPYPRDQSEVKSRVLAALRERLAEEREEWIRTTLAGAVEMVETGVSSAAAFSTESEEH